MSWNPHRALFWGAVSGVFGASISFLLARVRQAGFPRFGSEIQGQQLASALEALPRLADRPFLELYPRGYECSAAIWLVDGQFHMGIYIECRRELAAEPRGRFQLAAGQNGSTLLKDGPNRNQAWLRLITSLSPSPAVAANDAWRILCDTLALPKDASIEFMIQTGHPEELEHVAG